MRPISGTLLMVRLPATFSCGAWQGSWFIKSLNWSPEMVYVLSNLEQQNKATKTLNHQEIGNFESRSFLTRLPNTFSMHFHVWIHHLLAKSRSWNSSTFSTFRVLKPPAACRRSAKDLPPCRVSMQRILLRQVAKQCFLQFCMFFVVISTHLGWIVVWNFDNNPSNFCSKSLAKQGRQPTPILPPEAMPERVNRHESLQHSNLDVKKTQVARRFTIWSVFRPPCAISHTAGNETTEHRNVIKEMLAKVS